MMNNVIYRRIRHRVSRRCDTLAYPRGLSGTRHTGSKLENVPISQCIYIKKLHAHTAGAHPTCARVTVERGPDPRPPTASAVGGLHRRRAPPCGRRRPARTLQSTHGRARAHGRRTRRSLHTLLSVLAKVQFVLHASRRGRAPPRTPSPTPTGRTQIEARHAWPGDAKDALRHTATSPAATRRSAALALTTSASLHARLRCRCRAGRRHRCHARRSRGRARRWRRRPPAPGTTSRTMPRRARGRTTTS